MGREREQKIRRLREKKEREERLRAGREGVYERDEEAQREYFMDVLANDVDERWESTRTLVSYFIIVLFSN